jgi:hypothetical protein
MYTEKAKMLQRESKLNTSVYGIIMIMKIIIIVIVMELIIVIVIITLIII